MPELTVIDESIENALKKFPQLRQRAVESMAKRMKQELDTEISTRINDSHGKICGWQTIRVGSKGGYSVIEPIKGGNGKNSPGAITGYLERGHRIRPPKNNGSKGYRPRIRTSYVNGRWFYNSVEKRRDSILLEEANKISEELAATLEGRR